MTDAALCGVDQTPAWLAGHGPIPAVIVKHWLADEAMQVFLRRVFTRADDHQLVAVESRVRNCPPRPRRKILLRDDMCRTPWCENPAQQADHMGGVKGGGETSYANASGVWAGCNQTKGNTRGRHTGDSSQLNVPTPTGHT